MTERSKADYLNHWAGALLRALRGFLMGPTLSDLERFGVEERNTKIHLSRRFSVNQIIRCLEFH